MVRGLQQSHAQLGARSLTDEQAKLWTELCAGTAIERKFPMYVMPVQNVLKLDKLQTHEELFSLLVEYKPEMGKVLFCSHTWLKYTAPDDDAGSKLALLKELLNSILDGSMGTIDGSHPYYGKNKIDGKTLLRDMRKGYVWFDLFSVPQADREAQTKAIGSIVSYCTDSSYFFVLAGPWKHEDGSIRDERAWMRRGWCRLESLANALSPASKPLVVCRSPSSLLMHPPSGITKKSAFFATVGTGDFTVPDDKDCLGRVVEALVEVRKAFALKVGDLFVYRICCCAKAKLLHGLRQDPGAEATASYEEWMETLRFREGDLATEGKASGLTPLRFAVYANRLDVAERMLAVCPGLDCDAALKVPIPLVEGPKAQTITMAACAWYDNPSMVRLLHNHGADIMAIDKGIGHVAIFYAAGNDNVASIDALLEIGTNHQGKSVSAFHGSPISLPDPECKIYAPNFGVFTMFGEYGQLDACKSFAAKYPADWSKMFSQPPPGAPHIGLTIIGHSINVFGDVEMLRWLVEQASLHECDGANFAIKVTDPKALKVIGIFKTLLRLMKRPPVIVGYFLNALFGATPLHCASLQGNLGAVELLLSAGAHIDSQHQSLGRTPLMLAAIYGHRSICELLVQKGASLTVRDTRTGKTAAQWAALKGRRDLSLRLAPPTVFASPLGKGAKKYQVAPAAPPAKE
jgi:hypothetical protein